MGMMESKSEPNSSENISVAARTRLLYIAHRTSRRHSAYLQDGSILQAILMGAVPAVSKIARQGLPGAHGKSPAASWQ
jgi:hypothetical protein